MNEGTRAWVWSCLLIAACGSSSTKSDDAAEWLGDEPHFRAAGTIDGEDLDVDYRGDDVAKRDIHCELEYTTPALANGEADYAHGHLNEVKIDGILTVGGKKRALELEFKMHDYQNDAPG